MEYKCYDCGEAFDEPHRWVEMHGFPYGPGEHWSACPFCGGDYDETSVVDAEVEEDDPCEYCDCGTGIRICEGCAYNTEEEGPDAADSNDTILPTNSDAQDPV